VVISKNGNGKKGKILETKKDFAVKILTKPKRKRYG
jgi:hypothetical protein